jgi:hypothetical protein
MEVLHYSDNVYYNILLHLRNYGKAVNSLKSFGIHIKLTTIYILSN